jgi:hypothetical protein
LQVVVAVVVVVVTVVVVPLVVVTKVIVHYEEFREVPVSDMTSSQHCSTTA